VLASTSTPPQQPCLSPRPPQQRRLLATWLRTFFQWLEPAPSSLAAGQTALQLSGIAGALAAAAAVFEVACDLHQVYTSTTMSAEEKNLVKEEAKYKGAGAVLLAVGAAFTLTGFCAPLGAPLMMVGGVLVFIGQWRKSKLRKYLCG